MRRFFTFVFSAFFLLFFVVSPAWADIQIGGYWYVNNSTRMTDGVTGDLTSQINCSHNFDFLETVSVTHHYFTNCTTTYGTYMYVNTSTTGFGNSQYFELWDLSATPSATPTPTPYSSPSGSITFIEVASTSALANGLYVIASEGYIIGWILAIGVGWYIANWLYKR